MTLLLASRGGFSKIHLMACHEIVGTFCTPNHATCQSLSHVHAWSKVVNFSLILVFSRKKKYFGIFGKKSLFLLILRKSFVIFFQNCLVYNGYWSNNIYFCCSYDSRKAEPQLQLQQRHKQNLYLLQLQSRRYFTETINCNRSTFCSSHPC